MINNILAKIKQKKPLNNLSNEFVETQIEKFLQQNQKLRKSLLGEKLKKKIEEKIIKNVRSELNRIYGQFWIDEKQKLKSHKSTKERINNYDHIYSQIFSIAKKPKTVLDLGCGMNYITYTKFPEIEFIAVELTKSDCDNIKKYFIKNKIKGEVIQEDITKRLDYPHSNVCFMFKLLESLEIKKHKFAERLIKNIDSDFLAISFSTKTIKNKKMNYPKRGWLEIMLKRLNLEYKHFETENEIFYVINKN